MNIFKNEIKECDFESFMKFPSFYKIFQILIDKLFNIFTSLTKNSNYDEIINMNYRQEILSTYYHIKDKFNLRQNEFEGMEMFKSLLRFFEVFIDVIGLYIPLYSEKIDLARKEFELKHLEILRKSNNIMNKLYHYFDETGLVQFLTSDFNYTIHYRDQKSVAITTGEYYVYKEEDKPDIANIKRHDLESFANTENNNALKFLGRKRTFYSRDELKLESSINLNYSDDSRNRAPIVAKKNMNDYFIPCRIRIGFKLNNPYSENNI
jgi:hypothetical protein